MCTIRYRVSGTDVNDHMVMETHAYYAYSLRHIYNFLNELGFSRQNLNKMKIYPHVQRTHLEIFKPLMFGINFLIELKIRRYNYNSARFEMNFSYLNSSFECCATMKSELLIKSATSKEIDNDISKKLMNQIRIITD